jgi:hypothetical protein
MMLVEEAGRTALYVFRGESPGWVVAANYSSSLEQVSEDQAIIDFATWRMGS